MLALLGLLRAGSDAKWVGVYFFPPGMGCKLFRQVEKPYSFVEKICFLKLFVKIMKNHGI